MLAPDSASRASQILLDKNPSGICMIREQNTTETRRREARLQIYLQNELRHGPRGFDFRSAADERGHAGAPPQIEPVGDPFPGPAQRDLVHQLIRYRGRRFGFSPLKEKTLNVRRRLLIAVARSQVVI